MRAEENAIRWMASQLNDDALDEMHEVIVWVGKPYPMVIIESKEYTDDINRPRRGIVGAFNSKRGTFTSTP